MRTLLRFVLLGTALLGGALPLAAQPAESGWLDPFSVPGLSGGIARATLPDSGGVLVAGSFTHADGQRVPSVVRWTGAAWEPLGSLVGSVRSLVRPADGRIWAAGTFTELDQENRVVVWTGAEWESVGTFDLQIDALATLDGVPFVVGSFRQVRQPDGSVTPVRGAARWAGTRWEAAPGLEDSAQRLVVHDGTLIAVQGAMGRFWRWTGSAFEPFPGQARTQGTVTALASHAGRLVVGGFFQNVVQPTGVVLPARHLAVWTGEAWEPVGGGTGGGVIALRSEPGGSLLVSGQFRSVGPAEQPIEAVALARWSGTAWSAPAPGSTTQGVQHLLPWGDETLVSVLGTVSPSDAPGILTGPDPTTRSLGVAVLTADDRLRPVQGAGGANGARRVSRLVAGCGGTGMWAFGQEIGPARTRLARWTGTTWADLPEALANPSFLLEAPPPVLLFDLTPMPGACDEVILTGLFYGADGFFNVARWTGDAWAPLGGGTSGFVANAVGFADGSVVVAGGFDTVFQSDGTAISVPGLARWRPVGGWQAIGGPTSMLGIGIAADGDGVLVFGDFSQIRDADGTERSASSIARWSPAGWETFGGPSGPRLGTPIVAAARWSGGIAVSGFFSEVSGPDGVPVAAWLSASWDGTVWRPLGTVGAGGVYTSLVPVGATLLAASPSVYRFQLDGAAWQPLVPDSLAVPVDEAVAADGRLYVRGSFAVAGSVQSPGLAALGLAGLVADEPRPAAAAPLPLSVVPNPAAGRAAVAFTLDRPARVRVSVVDALGREVAVVLDAERAAGAHRADLDVSRLPPGVYAVRLVGPGAARARTFTVAR